MADTRLEERFAAFEAQVTGTFRPAPITGMTTRVRRRRRLRRGLLTGFLAALVATPAGGYAVAGYHDDARPGPTPTPTMTGPPRFDPVDRQIAVPGVTWRDAHVRLALTDAAHGWAFFERCEDENESTTCTYALGVTADAGATWNATALGTRADGRPVNIYPLDGRTLAVHVITKGFLLTTDGGATFTEYPESEPPVQAQRVNAGGDFALLCPGATGFQDGASSVECARPQVYKIGAGAVTPQPTLRGDLAELWQGGDGKLWLTSWDGDVTRVAISYDSARTWQEVGPVPAAEAKLTLSPTGNEVWAVTDEPAGLWRLDGSRFVAQKGLPTEVFQHNVLAIGDGILLIKDGNDDTLTGGFWQDGRYQELAGLRTVGMSVLPDGTIVVVERGLTTVVGTGEGVHRTWTRFSS
ncbi:hypothetical protein WEI85_12530 [Actinomycetes bacterium KLBMP 9797]